MYFCHYIVLVTIGWCIGTMLAKCVRDQARNSASLAQAGPSRLSESCRGSLWVLVCGSRLSDREKT